MVLAHLSEVGLGHETRAGAVQSFGHFFKAAAAVEFIQSGNDGIALGLCAGVLDGFPKRGIWNINLWKCGSRDTRRRFGKNCYLR